MIFRFEDELGLRRLSFIVGARYTLYRLDSLLWRHNEPTISSIVDIIPVRWLSRSVLRHCPPPLLSTFPLSFLRPPRLMPPFPVTKGSQLPRGKDPLGHDGGLSLSSGRLFKIVFRAEAKVLLRVSSSIILSKLFIGLFYNSLERNQKCRIIISWDIKASNWW